uniref:DUF569 domain-containing protein n=1 Tax=Aegilops tauschii TaxID=37682 RepID=M8C5E6_AEGTA
MEREETGGVTGGAQGIPLLLDRLDPTFPGARRVFFEGVGGTRPRSSRPRAVAQLRPQSCPVQFTGRCLRANGRYLSWNNGVSAEDIEDTYILLFPGILTALLPSRLIVYVRAGADGTRMNHGALVFRGRSVVRLRKKLMRRLDVSDLVMCVEAGTFGRPTPLVVDLPRSVRDLHIVVFAAGTPAHAEVRYPDVDAV